MSLFLDPLPPLEVTSFVNAPLYPRFDGEFVGYYQAYYKNGRADRRSSYKMHQAQGNLNNNFLLIYHNAIIILNSAILNIKAMLG